MTPQTKFSAIHSVLHFNGAKYGSLTTEQGADVRSFADGFGKTSNPDLLWDWSHVRDSSDSAIDLMYARIQELS
jgi:hypothetical protein